MKKIEVTSTFEVYEDLSKLTPIEQSVMKKAIDMLGAVYAPYSQFFVGAAVLTGSGSIYGGCNQENASYPLCICGERVALYSAGANEPNTPISLLAVVSHNPKKYIDKPVSPCGACRQVISEFEMRHKTPYPILLKGDSDIIYKLKSSAQLLPFGFDAGYL